MNYLAHTLLSKNHIDYQLGNLLADPLKGKAWAGCSSLHREGIAMHKAIDVFTDENTHVAQAKTYLGNGYLKGVVMDILFDHYIIKHWARFVEMDLEDFIQSFYQQAKRSQPQLPRAGQQFIARIIRYDFFHLYRDFITLEYVFQRFDNRLSANILAKESTSQYFPLIKRHDAAIEEQFLLFFPELIAFFLQTSEVNHQAHFFCDCAKGASG